MTVIAGYLCTDGVVLVADSAATLGVSGVQTITQRVRKLQIIDDSLILGVSGPVGFAQRATYHLGELWRDEQKKTFAATEVVPIMEKIRAKIWDSFLNVEIRVATVSKQLFGQASIQSSLAGFLIGAPMGDSFCLMQFDQQAAPEAATEDLPFMTIGCIPRITDTLLGFARHHFWADRALNTGEAEFTLMWTLEEAIRLAPGGVSRPLEVAVLRKTESGDTFARKLPDVELEEHRGKLQEFEKELPDRFNEWVSHTFGPAAAEGVSNPPTT